MEPVRLKYQLRPAEPSPSCDGPQFDLKVVFTDLRRTAAALAAARTLARGLGARITLMVAHVVPYPLPLATPDVSVEFIQRMLESSDADSVEIYLCRDRNEAIRDALERESLVIIGTRRRWWPVWERSLARLLRREGRRVLTV